MSDKKLTTEELTKQVEEAKKKFDTLSQQLNDQKQEEEDRRKAELAVQKETRKKEVEDALDTYQRLLKAFIRDYGSISISSNSDDWTSVLGSRPWHWWF